MAGENNPAGPDWLYNFMRSTNPFTWVGGGGDSSGATPLTAEEQRAASIYGNLYGATLNPDSPLGQALVQIILRQPDATD